MILGIPKKTLLIVAVLVGIGWVYLQGAGPKTSEGAETPAACRMTVNADVLNVRGGATTEADIVGKLKQEAETNAEPVVENGFRKLAENKWAAEEFLQPIDGARCG